MCTCGRDHEAENLIGRARIHAGLLAATGKPGSANLLNELAHKMEKMMRTKPQPFTGWEAITHSFDGGEVDTYIHYTNDEPDWVATNRRSFDSAFDDACQWFGEPLDCGRWDVDEQCKDLPLRDLPLGPGCYAAQVFRQKT
jgi:hypothetical protein